MENVKDLQNQYIALICGELPVRAKESGWAVNSYEGLQRIILDHVFDGQYEDFIRPGSPPLYQLDTNQLKLALALAANLTTGDPQLFAWMYEKSCQWRGTA